MLKNIFEAIVFLGVLQISLSHEICPERKVFFVASTGVDSKECLRSGDSNHSCASISYLVQRVYQCAVIKILDDLILNNTLLYLNSDWMHISITGCNESMEGVTVHCEGNSGIVVQSMSGFGLENLHFRGCSLDVSAYQIYADINFIYAAVMILNSEGIYIRHCSFRNHSGSALLMVDVIGTTNIEDSVFGGNSSLLDNYYYSRTGGIVIRTSTTSTRNTTFMILRDKFISNVYGKYRYRCVGEVNGGAIDIKHLGYSNLSFSVRDSIFLYNSAEEGGAINAYISHYILMSIKNTEFQLNNASCTGGAVNILYYNEYENSDYYITDLGELEVKNCIFDHNKAAYSGGALSVSLNDGNILFRTSISETMWRYNSATFTGLAISLYGPGLYVSFSGDNNFYMNTGTNFASGLGVIKAVITELTFSEDAIVDFSHNSQSAIYLDSSLVVFNGSIFFFNNSGIYGGAIWIQEYSFLKFGPFCDVLFEQNTALAFGGAIYSRVIDSCTFDVSDMTESSLVSFKDNSASVGNNSIYFENFDFERCIFYDYVSNFSFLTNSTYDVVYPLFYVKFNITPSHGRVMLGEEFYLHPYDLEDLQHQPTVGAAYVSIYLHPLQRSEYLLNSPSNINLDGYTSAIKFSIRGPKLINESKHFDISLLFGTPLNGNLKQIVVPVYVIPCKLGYEYSRNKGICDCANSQPNIIKCNYSSPVLCVKMQYWYSSAYNKAYPCSSKNCIYDQDHCRMGYDWCSTSEGYCAIQESNDVCREGRAGFLCSECADNHTFTYNSLKCVKNDTCSLKNTMLFFLALLVYWILTVFAFLLILSLEYSTGSGFMYGIVYFFSIGIVYIKSSDVYSSDWVHILVYMDEALSLLNPEILGFVNVCFVESLRSPLSHELFQLVTPVFIILTLMISIYVTHYCRIAKCVKLSQNSSIHAICLLILLSYTSISFTSLNILIPTEINGHLKVQIAPTVSYFGKEHIPYAIVAILLESFFCLPICFLFLFSPQLSKHFNLVRLRLKPIVDEFQACYKPKYRWFSGFYFLTRQILYLVHMTFSGPFSQYNNLLIMCNVFILITHTGIQPYSRNWLNMVDTILLTDIVVLSTYSAIAMNSFNTADNIFFNYMIPYILLFIPTVYLIGILGVVSLKKLLYSKFGKTRCLAKLIKIHQNSTLFHESGRRMIEIANDENDDLLFTHERFRTPLLKAANSDTLKKYSYEDSY